MPTTSVEAAYFIQLTYNARFLDAWLTQRSHHARASLADDPQARAALITLEDALARVQTALADARHAVDLWHVAQSGFELPADAVAIV